MIYKGLDDDESRFLNFVADQQAQQKTAMQQEEMQELSDFRVTSCTHTRAHARTHTHTHTHTHACVHPHMHTHTHTSTPTLTHTSTHTHKHTRIRIHIGCLYILPAIMNTQEAVAKLHDEAASTAATTAASDKTPPSEDSSRNPKVTSPKPPSLPSKTQKSQLSLIAGSIRTKRKR